MIMSSEIAGSAVMSDSMRKVMRLANQEAQRLNHLVIGVEHVLLGLAKEGHCKASWALRWSGFDLMWLRTRVERFHPRESADQVVPGILPYTEALKAYFDAKVGEVEPGERGLLEPE